MRMRCVLFFSLFKSASRSALALDFSNVVSGLIDRMTGLDETTRRRDVTPSPTTIALRVPPSRRVASRPPPPPCASLPFRQMPRPPVPVRTTYPRLRPRPSDASSSAYNASAPIPRLSPIHPPLPPHLRPPPNRNFVPHPAADAVAPRPSTARGADVARVTPRICTDSRATTEPAATRTRAHHRRDTPLPNDADPRAAADAAVRTWGYLSPAAAGGARDARNREPASGDVRVLIDVHLRRGAPGRGSSASTAKDDGAVSGVRLRSAAPVVHPAAGAGVSVTSRRADMEDREGDELGLKDFLMRHDRLPAFRTNSTAAAKVGRGQGDGRDGERVVRMSGNESILATFANLPAGTTAESGPPMTNVSDAVANTAGRVRSAPRMAGAGFGAGVNAATSAATDLRKTASSSTVMTHADRRRNAAATIGAGSSGMANAATSIAAAAAERASRSAPPHVRVTHSSARAPGTGAAAPRAASFPAPSAGAILPMGSRRRDWTPRELALASASVPAVGQGNRANGRRIGLKTPMEKIMLSSVATMAGVGTAATSTGWLSVPHGASTDTRPAPSAAQTAQEAQRKAKATRAKEKRARKRARKEAERLANRMAAHVRACQEKEAAFSPNEIPPSRSQPQCTARFRSGVATRSSQGADPAFNPIETPPKRRLPPRAARPDFLTRTAPLPSPSPPPPPVHTPTSERRSLMISLSSNSPLYRHPRSDMRDLLVPRASSSRRRMSQIESHPRLMRRTDRLISASRAQPSEVIDVDDDDFLVMTRRAPVSDVVNLVSDDEDDDDDVPLHSFAKRRRVEQRSTPPLTSKGDTDFDDVAIVSHVVRGAGVALAGNGDDAAPGGDGGNGTSGTANPTDEELVVVGSRRGLQALVDLPHLRFQCGKVPFGNGTRSQSCPMCYCFVCDSLVADCSNWSKHCRATDNSEKWKQAREDAREKRLLAEKKKRQKEEAKRLKEELRVRKEEAKRRRRADKRKRDSEAHIRAEC